MVRSSGARCDRRTFLRRRSARSPRRPRRHRVLRVAPRPHSAAGRPQRRGVLLPRHLGSGERAQGARAREEALREADRRKDEFLATLSHELRNPLAPLRNALEILRAWPRRREPPVVAMMERQLKQLVRSVDDLLEVSRITRGSFELRRERAALAGIVRTAVETAESSSAPRTTARRFAVARRALGRRRSGAPCPDRRQPAEQRREIHRDGGRIELQVRRDGAQALVSVRDNGAGSRRRRWRAFSAVRARRAPKGLGIGLALARSLARCTAA